MYLLKSSRESEFNSILIGNGSSIQYISLFTEKYLTYVYNILNVHEQKMETIRRIECNATVITYTTTFI